MTKRDFKKKCRAEKAVSYKLMLAGGAIAVLGLIVVLLSFMLDGLTVQIVGFVCGGAAALIGILLDAGGEILFSKEYREHLEKSDT